jgi:hypothetical protein
MALLQVSRRSEGVVIALQNPLFAWETTKTVGAIASIGRQGEGFENLYLEKPVILHNSAAIRWRSFRQSRCCAELSWTAISANLESSPA